MNTKKQFTVENVGQDVWDIAVAFHTNQYKDPKQREAAKSTLFLYHYGSWDMSPLWQHLRTVEVGDSPQIAIDDPSIVSTGDVHQQMSALFKAGLDWASPDNLENRKRTMAAALGAAYGKPDVVQQSFQRIIDGIVHKIIHAHGPDVALEDAVEYVLVEVMNPRTSALVRAHNATIEELRTLRRNLNRALELGEQAVELGNTLANKVREKI